ncbi:MAG TPA: LCP family protein [Candidatus Acutalibacter stercorigallinarum]|nr:LCP family protein [Candidatus Acutalibacter stercorigallinarum]
MGTGRKLTRGQKAAWALAAGAAALVLAAVGAVAYYGNILHGAVEQATAREPDRAVVGVYVEAGDPAQSLEDTAGYAYGAAAGEPHGEQAQAALRQRLGEVEIASSPTAFALADRLKAGEVRAILLGDAYAQALSEAPGYQWTARRLRQVGSLELELEDTPEPLAVPEDLPRRFLVYLSGTDTFGSAATRARSDVNILAAVDTQEKKLLLVATPRDFYVTFPETGGAGDKLAHAGIYGVEASAAALEGLYGVAVNYWVKLNFTGFVELIDALGGVEVYSDQAFTVEPIRTYQQGYNQLTGLEALAFARERYSFPDGDYQRAKNQMEVIRAVVEKCSSFALVQNFRPVLEAAGEHLETNMPKEHLYGLAAQQLGDPGPWTVETYTAQGESAYRETYSMPGQELYVILPGEDSVQEAKEKLAAVLG